MPRRPTRPDVSLKSPGHLTTAFRKLQDTRTPLKELPREVLWAIIFGLLRALPSHRQEAMWRRLRQVTYGYALARIHVADQPERLGAWADGVMRGHLDRRDRCDPLVLLQHKALALVHLETTPGRRYAYSAHRRLSLQERLPKFFKAVASHPCSCGRARTDLPPPHVLDKWPLSPGGLVIQTVAWFHRVAFATARKRLAAAPRNIVEIRTRLAQS